MESIFYPTIFSLFTHSPDPLRPQDRERPPSLSSSTSLSPWISKDSTMEKVQDWMEIALLKTLHWFPFEFFGFLSSSSLSRYSKLCFARSPYMVQRFEFPLVEHLMRSPRSHTYRSKDFCWTHCENSRIGGGQLAPVWLVHPTGLTGGGCQTLSPIFFVFFDPYLCRNTSSSSISTS
jgi:hypothetical protein